MNSLRRLAEDQGEEKGEEREMIKMQDDHLHQCVRESPFPLDENDSKAC